MKNPHLIIWELRTQKLIQSRNRLYLAKLALTRFLFLAGLESDELATVSKSVESFPVPAYKYAAARINPSKSARLKRLVASVAVAVSDSSRHRSNIPCPYRDCMFICSN